MGLTISLGGVFLEPEKSNTPEAKKTAKGKCKCPADNKIATSKRIMMHTEGGTPRCNVALPLL